MRHFLHQKRAARKAFYRLTQLLLIAFVQLISVPLFAQTTMQGKVMSAEGPVAGVTVTVKGTQTSTITDADGKFSIQAPEKATLVFTHVNFQMQEKPAGGNMVITLEASKIDLSEVVVVGYNTQKKATVTGSISVVKGTDLVKSPNVNVSNSLAGRFSGVMINNRGGEPGYDGSSIRIRGLATVGNNDVLIV